MINDVILQALDSTLEGKYLLGRYPDGLNAPFGPNAFTDGGHGPQLMVAEAMRALIIAQVSGCNVLLPKEGPLFQIEYLKNLFGMDFCDVGIVEYHETAPHTIRVASSMLPEHSLHVMHPFDVIPQKIYANPPELLLKLNSKDNMQYYPSIPNRAVIAVESLLLQLPEMQPPYVLKKIAGTGGDGVKVVTQPCLDEIASFVNGQSKVIVEEYIDTAVNYAIQFFIADDGSIHLLGWDKQKTTPTGQFEGVTCYLDEAPPKNLYGLGYASTVKVKESGYVGFCAFDILEDKLGKYFLIDPNIRMVAPSPVYLLSDKLSKLIGPYCYVESMNLKANDPMAAAEQITKSGGVLLSISHGVNGVYKAIPVFGGATDVEAYEKWTGFNEKHGV